ncbi:hypothetical protein BLL36_06855 [Pseudomonas cedrina subsp. cedrina]|uniref:EamA domain-containing protein n=1 Tax=Pseudomonas cedrina subsp. cedrina TaxID=76762 RepID=A0A1V2KDU0_PSECE|nr:hypothetical protein BLL36_06855 [Pseudomonas cedrina subsp. cedrina]
MVMYLLLSGMALMVGMQFAIFCVALKNSLGSAVLCLFIPFYVYVYAKKDPQAKPFLWAWYAGIGLLITGVIASA